MDSTFYGRSRAISCLTETIKYEGNDPVLEKIVNGFQLFSFNLDELIRDGLVESIWCKNGSDEKGCNEIFYQVKADDIDFSALDWHKVDVKQGLLYAVIRHYMIVLKNGCIPPEYIISE